MVVKVVLDKDFKGPVFSKCKVAFCLLEDNGLRRGDSFVLVFDGVRGRLNCIVDNVIKRKVEDVDFFMARAEGYVCSDLLVHCLRLEFPVLAGDDFVFQYYFKIL